MSPLLAVSHREKHILQPPAETDALVEHPRGWLGGKNLGCKGAEPKAGYGCGGHLPEKANSALCEVTDG